MNGSEDLERRDSKLSRSGEQERNRPRSPARLCAFVWLDVPALRKGGYMMWVWEEQIWNFLTTATSAALEGYLAFHFKVRITIAGKEALEKK